MFARADERQFVFIVHADHGLAVFETAEMWEEPWLGAVASYHHYPTVMGCARFENVDDALRYVSARYRWIPSKR